ncbi:MAG: glucose dehydrogenase [Alphaproteobacteria bacterium]|nr:glucose dehydrogenase [Alphaproteobacteria bacterium]
MDAAVAERFDTVVVGAGSAGCVMAHRLSADAGRRVLLVEAGRDHPPGREPADILDSFAHMAYMNPDYLWTGLRVRYAADLDNRPGRAAPRKYEQGRVVGGGSSINGMMANRGLPEDYTEWAALGAEGWDWDGVLPFFRRLEHDLDFDGPLHGKDGRILVRRLFPESWPGFTRAAAAAMAEAGHRYFPDQNGDFADGYFPIAISNVLNRRVSSAIAYLDPVTRQRPNLAIMDRTEVERLVFDGRRLTGLVINRDGRSRSIAAGEVVLTAGALHTPTILMRSGVGPAAHLRERGVEVVADRAGVGRNLMEHPNVSLCAWMKPEARLPPEMRRQMIVALRYSSGVPDCPAGDMFMVPTNKTAWHPLGARIGAIMVWVNKSYSKGRVELAGPDFRTPPDVAFEMLSDRRDLERLKRAMRMILDLYERPPLAGAVDDLFPATLTDRVREIGAIRPANYWKTAVAGRMMDASAAIRRAMIRNVITPGIRVEEVMADDRALEDWIVGNVTGTWHPSCTCRMGRADDPYAVADPAGRVRGIEGVRVADASAMPVVPRANTNVPTMMMAEKIAEAIRAGR